MVTVTDNSTVGKQRELSCTEKGFDCNFDEAASECSTAMGGIDSCSEQGDECFVPTLTIIDWDDTLFPTTWLRQQGLLADEVAPRGDQSSLLQKLASSAEKTLRLALEFGKVVIVTNAQQGWVELCCANLMPSLNSVLEDVAIVSARSAYEACSNCPADWKRLAFDLVFENEFLNEPRSLQYNVISLGDSLYEQQALTSLCQKRHDVLGKSMKFLEAPAIEQLIEEHEFAVSCFLQVAEHNGSLDVEIAI
jgi:hypothetical protein